MVTFAQKYMRIILKIAIPCIVFCILFTSCSKDELVSDENATVKFSTDTVYFDTVLVTLGSVTNSFKIYNPYDQPLEIDHIYLARGDKSFFRLNVDGTSGNDFKNIRIARKDSLYVFVAVTIDPLDASSPMIIKDSVICRLKSNRQDVKLIAYGQDVHLLNGEIFETQTWINDKPYLIVNSAALDSNEILTIEPGTQIFLTHNSSLIVWGKIQAFGTYENPIIFSGARRDGRYRYSADQWRTIYIGEKSQNNILEHVIIENAVVGLQVGYPSNESAPSIELSNCMIFNSGSVGIYSFNATINVYNTVIADCGSFALLIQMGGSYNFYHCTISNISAYFPDYIYTDDFKPRKYPSVFFTNYFNWYDLDQDYRIIDVTFPQDLEINFYNSIIYGKKSSEIYYDSLNEASLNYNFKNCLLKLHEDSVPYFDSLKMIAIILNKSPDFVNDSIPAGEYNFELNNTSPAINKGNAEWNLGIPELESDIKGNPRPHNANPDLGAYELQE